MKGIYKFHGEMRRSADLEGVFTAEDYEVEWLIGQTLYFGEIAGKHSEVVWDVEEGEITLVSQDQSFVEMFVKNGLETGLNPFDYLDSEAIEELGKLTQENDN